MRKQAALLALLLRQRSQLKRAAEFSADACSFGPQRRLIKSKHKRKIAKCGRRSGKTVGVAIALLLAAMELPAVPVLYVTLTRENAREIIWGDLLRMNEEYQLGFKVSESRLTLTSPIGVQIQLRGAHTEREIAKFRGKKNKLAIIDEAQSFPDRILEPLIREVIGPTLMDYDGDLWLVGTPTPLRKGYFFRCYAGDLAEGRDQHHWTVRDNERFPARLAGLSVEDILAQVRKENGWTVDSPTYLREYEGQDVEDLESLLFEYREATNGFAELPLPFPLGWKFVLALDLGHDDNSALACLGWPPNQRRVFLVDEWNSNKVDVTDCANHVAEFRAKYSPVGMVIDTGGLGKMIAAEIGKRHKLPMTPADKAEKGAHIKLLNTALRKGELMAKADSVFAEECGLVLKDVEALAQGKLQELPRAKGGFHGNMTDAVLYGWRKCWAFLEKEPQPQVDGYVPPTETTRRLMAEQRR